jgi:hypothetical protein
MNPAMPACRFVLLLIVAGTSMLAAEEPLRSSLQVGEKIFATFEPLNVTGPHAGEPHCLVCENGLNPVAMVFARAPSEPLLRLLARLDAAVGKHEQAQLGSFAVFLSDREGLAEQLAQAADKNKLKRLVLSIDQPAGPEGFRVAPEAEVTVVLYNKYDVLANHAFRKGELNDRAIERVLGDLPKILPEKK